METPNICPKCGAINSLIICSMRAINCSACMEYIRPAEKGEVLLDQPEMQNEEKKTPSKTNEWKKDLNLLFLACVANIEKRKKDWGTNDASLLGECFARDISVKVEQFISSLLEERDREWERKINDLYAYVDKMWADEHDDNKADQLLNEVLEHINQLIQRR